MKVVGSLIQNETELFNIYLARIYISLAAIPKGLLNYTNIMQAYDSFLIAVLVSISILVSK
jgi:hypothetical protein